MAITVPRAASVPPAVLLAGRTGPSCRALPWWMQTSLSHSISVWLKDFPRKQLFSECSILSWSVRFCLNTYDQIPYFPDHVVCTGFGVFLLFFFNTVTQGNFKTSDLNLTYTTGTRACCQHSRVFDCPAPFLPSARRPEHPSCKHPASGSSALESLGQVLHLISLPLD